MIIVKREIQNGIEKSLFKGKIIIIYGARQVGKTTLIREIQKKYSNDSLYVNCDEPDIQQALTNKTSTELKNFIGNKRLILIDEAQRVINIGLALKLLVDNYPDIQVIATGSSSFDLSNQIIEPLTGRKHEFYLYPFSFSELKTIYSELELNRLIENRIIFGMYPDVVLKYDESENLLREISRSYLYKDVLQYQNIKSPDLLERLLQALALQIGNEVSYNELAVTVGVDKKTIASYISLLEKAFIIFRLNPYSRNLRNELRKLRKIYFVDTGIRNALINNLNPLNLRGDTGNLWENFLISERIKLIKNRNVIRNTFFWRTHQQYELDYIEEEKGKLFGYEFKWNKKTFKEPKIFIEAYPGSEVNLINKNNYQHFLEI